MRNLTLLFGSLLLCISACSSDRHDSLSLFPATSEIQGAPGALSFNPNISIELTATAKDQVARLELEKPEPDIHFYRLELIILDADRQPLPEAPVLNAAPNDLEKLNSKRTGKFSLRFRAGAPSKEPNQIGENRRNRNNPVKSAPLSSWVLNARYFLLRAETDRSAKNKPSTAKPIPANSDAPKTIPEVIAMAEPAVFFVYSFDEAGNGLKQGSGFFIDPSGIGVSNHHVFEGGIQWAIQTIDKRQYRVSEVLQSSKEYDHVVFRVEASEPFPFLKIAAGKAQKGEEILVIGNPRGLESTVTQGIVSALRDPMIQIDAAVSPGNSGGPVLNRKGEVLGIATQKMRDCENCNFAFDIRVLGIGN